MLAKLGGHHPDEAARTPHGQTRASRWAGVDRHKQCGKRMMPKFGPRRLDLVSVYSVAGR